MNVSSIAAFPSCRQSFLESQLAGSEAENLQLWRRTLVGSVIFLLKRIFTFLCLTFYHECLYQWQFGLIVEVALKLAESWV